MMKKFKKLLIGLVTLVTMAVICTVCAGAYYKDGFGYDKLSDGTYSVSYYGDNTTLVVPATVDGIKITRFDSAFGDGKYVEKVTLPEGITQIDENAFSNCEYLKQITIPSTVTKIGKWAFQGCDCLTSIKLPDNLTVIDEYTFNDCLDLSSVTLPAKLTKINKFAFNNCDSLKSITIPKSVTKIEDYSIGYHDFTEQYTDFTIYCYTGSAGEKYAKDNGFKYKLLDAHTHSYGSWKITKAATCTATGTRKKTCSCGKSITEEIPATGHKYVSSVVNSTFTSKGYTLHKCSVCGTSYKDNYKPMLSGTAMYGLKLSSRKENELTFSWTKNPTVNGYIVEQYKGDKWVRIARIASNATTSQRVTGLKAGTAYKFRIKTYKTSGTKTQYGTYSNISARTNPSKVTGFSLSGRTSNTLSFKWTKNTSADGYIIEKYNGSEWVRAARISGNATVSYRVSGLAAGTAYKFRIKAYKMSGSTVLYSGNSATVAARTNPSDVTGFKVSEIQSSSIKLAWSKNNSADGYIIEMYNNGSWVRKARLSSNSTISYLVSGLSSNVTYKFRIKAYKMSGSTALYSGYANTSAVIESAVAVTDVKLNVSSCDLFYGTETTKYSNLNGSNPTLSSTLQLAATITPTDATDKTVTYKSSNTSVATVSSTGLITAVSSGTATITATVGDKSATCEVTVHEKPNFTVALPTGTFASTSLVLIQINNKNSQSIKVCYYGRLDDPDYDAFDRDLQLMDENTFRDINYLYIGKGATNAVYRMANNKDTYYDKNTFIGFVFEYDGVEYLCSASANNGAAYTFSAYC